MLIVVLGMMSGMAFGMFFTTHLLLLMTFNSYFYKTRKTVSAFPLYVIALMSILSLFLWSMIGTLLALVNYFFFKNPSNNATEFFIYILIGSVVFFLLSYFFARKLILHVLLELFVFGLVYGLLIPYLINRLGFS